MTILALEFSSPQRSVAIIRRDELHESTISVNEVIETGANSPFPMIEAALRDAKVEREQIQCIAIGVGPGSYTGIRAAISIAQGWQLARGIKSVGVSSAECLAAQAQTDGVTGQVSVIVDAQREEFYLATYEIAVDGYREIAPLKIVSKEAVQQRANNGETLIGPEVARWFSTGKTVFPRAATVGTLALARTDFIAGEKLEPIYLRETTFVKAPPPRIIS
jgi:tRNA threonylcarbamoyl adenosine modification protein YeaZ